MTERQETIGLIAGNGRFPFLVCEGARKKNVRVVCCALMGEADPFLKEKVDAFEVVKIGELKKLVQFFKQENVARAIMAGKVEKVKLFQENVRPDFEMMKIVMKIRDLKDDTILGAIADFLESSGIQLLDSTCWIQDAMPGEGVHGKVKPSKDIEQDIQFGYKLAKEIAGLDLGQTVVVKKKAAIAVEAIEGTDQTILRAGSLAKEGMTVVKVAKPKQDMRFDVPAVGLNTLQALIEAKVAAFAFEANKTIFMDYEEFVTIANAKKIAVVGITSQILTNV